MATAPPPLPPSKDATPFRDFALPPQLGDELGLLRVVECTPDQLRLSVHAGCMLVGGLVSLIVAVVASIIYWYMPKSAQTGAMEISSKVFTVALLAAVVAPFLLANIGHSMEFDRIRRVVRVTWFYFKTREHSADRLKAVVLAVKKLTPALAAKNPPPGANPAPPAPRYANSVNCFLEGIDENNRPLQIKISDATLSSKKDWPALASTAIHLSKILRLPLRIEGALDELNETATGQMDKIGQLAGGTAGR